MKLPLFYIGKDKPQPFNTVAACLFMLNFDVGVEKVITHCPWL